jgi:hypothetical protein
VSSTSGTTCRTVALKVKRCHSQARRRRSPRYGMGDAIHGTEAEEPRGFRSFPQFDDARDSGIRTRLRTLWGSGRAKTDEVIINSHTAGCNANEENGAWGVVVPAKYFAKIPRSAIGPGSFS